MRSNYILLFLEFYVFSSNGLHYSLQVLRKSYLYGEYLSIQGGLLSFQTSSNARSRSFPRFAHALSVLTSAPRRRAHIADILRGKRWHPFSPFQVLLTFQ